MGKKCILVVDDDELVLRAYRRTIGREARLLTATTPTAARQVARDQPPDAAVVDLWLGRDSGIDLVRELKRQRPDSKCC